MFPSSNSARYGLKHRRVTKFDLPKEFTRRSKNLITHQHTCSVAKFYDISCEYFTMSGIITLSSVPIASNYCPACRTSLIATRFWVVVICPIIKCLTILEFSFILFDFCLFITIFNFILNYIPIVTFWIFTYHKIWILLIIFCFTWNYWIIYFLTCLEVFWSVVS